MSEIFCDLQSSRNNGGAARLQKRDHDDVKDVSDANVHSSQLIFQFENFVQGEWREEKFFKGSVGDNC